MIDIDKFIIYLLKQSLNSGHRIMIEGALADQGLRFNGETLVEIGEQPHIVSDEVKDNSANLLLDGIDMDRMEAEYCRSLKVPVGILDDVIQSEMCNAYRQGLEDMLQAIRDNNKKKGE